MSGRAAAGVTFDLPADNTILDDPLRHRRSMAGRCADVPPGFKPVDAAGAPATLRVGSAPA